MASKQWGKHEFWGLGSEYDPDWLLTDAQKALRDRLIEVCRTKIRPHAIFCDQSYTYPRKSLNALADLGLLGLIVPKHLGGLGENHVCCAMVVETIARYGCPSTAIVYTMHLGAVATLVFRYHGNERIQNLLKRLDKDHLVGTLSYSDPATGGHFWYPLSSKTQLLGSNSIQILKYASWTTSAGFADWYTIQTVSPNFKGDYSNLSCYLVYKDEIRANTDEWRALGMHGNQSGPLVVEGVFNMDRMIGPEGDGALSNDECVDPYFLFCSAACWNGIALGCIDLAKKHVTRKAHADVAMRVCDYPTIQDYFGECVSGTNACRGQVFMVVQGMDAATNNNDWSLHKDLDFSPRGVQYLHWCWQCKFSAAKNVTTVTDTMMHACGGTGYKTELGLERLCRDGKAAWVMGPSNEILRQFVGKSSLLGLSAVDFWDQHENERVVYHELGKLSLNGKREVLKRLSEDLGIEENKVVVKHPYQDTDFENPFSTGPPTVLEQAVLGNDGKKHNAALAPAKWVALKLASRSEVSEKMASFVFSLPNATDHTGLIPGQYVAVQVKSGAKCNTRFFSPVSRPDDFGRIELVMRFETHGFMSQHFKALKPGDKVEFRGPCGGFEYTPNSLDELILLASGAGITPGLQLIRCIMGNPADLTRVKLIYYSDSYDDILYREELEKYAAHASKRLHVLHTLGETPEQWEGEEGFINTEIIDKHVAKPNGLKHKIVLCGGPTMAISCLHSLRSLKYPSDTIFVYGQFGTEQIRAVFGRNIKLSGHRCDNVV